MPASDPIYRHEFVVTPDMLDENGHVNNVIYVYWMQDVAIQHSASCGGRQMMEELEATWVARSHKIEYLSPAFEGDQVTALTWLAGFRRVRATRRYKFVRKADGTVLSRGETDWVLIDVKSRRPRSIPEQYIGAIQTVPEGKEP